MLEIQKEKEESSYNEIAYLELLTKQYDDSVYNIDHTDGLLNRIRRSDSLSTEDEQKIDNVELELNNLEKSVQNEQR